MGNLEEYLDLVGADTITAIIRQASSIYGKHMLHLNSTYLGGGVAEMLSSLLPLTNDASVDAGWRVLHGNSDFFAITKQFHNSLQGGRLRLTRAKKEIYLETNRKFSIFTHIDHDMVVVHDPQPLPMIRYYRKSQPWIWRCHIDITDPNRELWEFLKTFIIRYDVVIISSEDYRKPDLPVEQRVIHPAIDPLAPKNRPMGDQEAHHILDKFGIPTDRPILAQVSRFDRWKDPLGVLDVYRKVRRKVDCRLVLCGSMASDDPEGYSVYDEVREKSSDLLEKGDLILITYQSNRLVNAIQRAATVVIQKSVREGFGLTVTEAMWKSRPVVASAIGGIPLQIEDGTNGFTLPPRDADAFADRIVELVRNPALCETMGTRARETVRQRFLVTRLLKDYLELFADLTG
ncbi:glycosyltransferase [Candidatus Fermentibacterales bacterium]|nr:glycosyltransferase [Candidatus Fermentibacterales bacterium]